MWAAEGDTRRRACGGFTLLEVIVAIAVFAVMTTAGFGGLRNVLAQRAALDHHQAEFADLQTAVSYLQQDIENVTARSIRDEFGGRVAALRGGIDGALLELTRYTAAGQFRNPAVDLRRIEYRLEADRLFRLSWEELDRYQGSAPRRRLLLSGVAGVDVRFFRDGWRASWPLAPGPESLDALPEGVEVSLHFRNGKDLQRTFLVEN